MKVQKQRSHLHQAFSKPKDSIAKDGKTYFRSPPSCHLRRYGLIRPCCYRSCGNRSFGHRPFGYRSCRHPPCGHPCWHHPPALHHLVSITSHPPHTKSKAKIHTFILLLNITHSFNFACRLWCLLITAIDSGMYLFDEKNEVSVYTTHVKY